MPEFIAQVPVEKNCCVCGRDVRNVRRIKDKQGSYYCESCFNGTLEQQEQVQVGKLPVTPDGVAPTDLLFCEQCGGQYPHNLLQLATDGRVLCRICTAEGKTGKALSAGGRWVGIVAITLSTVFLGQAFIVSEFRLEPVGFGLFALNVRHSPLSVSVGAIMSLATGAYLYGLGRKWFSRYGDRWRLVQWAYLALAMAWAAFLLYMIFGATEGIWLYPVTSAKGANPDAGRHLRVAVLYPLFPLIGCLVAAFIPRKTPDQDADDSWTVSSTIGICVSLVGVIALSLIMLRTSRPTMGFNEAAMQGDITGIKWHLDWGSNPNAANENGFTPLHAAASSGSKDAVQLLLDNGADPNAVGTATTPYGQDINAAPLDIALEKGSAEIVELLLSKGAAPQGGSPQSIPLIQAAEGGKAWIVQLLLNAGALPDTKSKSMGRTALMAAAAEGHADVVTLLLAKHADVNLQDDYGSTALHLAAMRGQAPVVQLLLRAKADTLAKDKEGFTALQMAVKRDQKAVVQLLSTGGADGSQSDVSSTIGDPNAASSRQPSQGNGGRSEIDSQKLPSSVSYRASVGDSSQQGTPSNVPPTPAASPVIAAFRPALTEANCHEWAEKLERETATGDAAFIVGNLDTDRLAERAVTGIQLTDESMQKVRSLGKEFIKQTGDMGASLIKSHPCKVLGTRQVNGEWSAMVRCLLIGGGVDYLKLTLAPDAAGDVRIVDLFELSSGGEWSGMLRTIALPLVVSSDTTALRNLKPDDRETLNNAALLGEIYRKNDPKDVPEIPRLFDQLPPSLQNNRYLSILDVKATAQVSDVAFTTAVQRHQTKFPNDPSLSYASFQKYFHDKDYAKMLEALFTLDDAVGGDPYLSGQKAAAYAGIGNVAQAKQQAQAAVSKEPSLAQPNWILFYLAIDGKNYVEATRLLTLLENQIGESIPDMTQDADFAGFVASPQYKSWSAARRFRPMQPVTK